MTKHTPGPWNIEDDYPAQSYGFSDQDILIQINGGDGLIAWVDGTPVDNPEVGANARLIAAAPDLLAALEMLVAWHDYDYQKEDGDEVITVEAFLEQARMALAKVAPSPLPGSD